MCLLIKRCVGFLKMWIVWGIGSAVFGTIVYVMAREFFNHLHADDEDIEMYGNDRTRIRHEEGI